VPSQDPDNDLGAAGRSVTIEVDVVEVVVSGNVVDVVDVVGASVVGDDKPGTSTSVDTKSPVPPPLSAATLNSNRADD
jgi:hypothetical protein